MTVPTTKICPRCAETIPVAAVVCRYCRSELGAQSEGRLISTWVSAHPTITASLATFLYVTFQVYKAADFQVNTAVELISADGLTKVVVGVFLVQLQYELILLTVIGCFWLTAAGRESGASGFAGISVVPSRIRADERIVPKMLLLAFLVVSMWTVSWPFAIGMLLIAGWAWYLADHRRDRPGMWTCFHMAALLVFGVLPLVRPTIWVPAETVVTTDRGTLVGYVIASNDGWLTILTPSWTNHLDGRTSDLMVEKADNVVSRQPCAIDFAEAKLFGRVTRLRPAEVVSALVHRRLPATLTPPCAP